MRCLFNLSPDPLALPAPPSTGHVVLFVNGASVATMPGYSALYLSV
jgi:hypothetical protein